MNPLLEAQAFLADGLRHDPLLCLASTVASLDPLWTEGDMDDWTGDDDNTLGHALGVCGSPSRTSMSRRWPGSSKA